MSGFCPIATPPDPIHVEHAPSEQLRAIHFFDFAQVQPKLVAWIGRNDEAAGADTHNDEVLSRISQALPGSFAANCRLSILQYT